MATPIRAYRPDDRDDPRPPRPADAYQLFVRGFERPDVGESLVERLGQMGFEVTMATTDDSLGGLIETAIAPAEQLDAPDGIEAIWDELAAVVPDGVRAFLQYRAFAVVADSSLPADGQ